MGEVVGTWRLKIILLLVVFSTCTYAVAGLFGNIGDDATINEDGYIIYDVEDTQISYNQTDLGTEKSQSFVDVLIGIGDFLTFAQIDNAYARFFLNVVMGLVWITIGYVLYTFVKEWIPFV